MKIAVTILILAAALNFQTTNNAVTPASGLRPSEACICPDIFLQVCGRDGNTYSNSCRATCAGTTVAYQGQCARVPIPVNNCICPYYYSPVCGVNGKTYRNQCTLRCAGVRRAYRGACQDYSDSYSYEGRY